MLGSELKRTLLLKKTKLKYREGKSNLLCNFYWNKNSSESAVLVNTMSFLLFYIIEKSYNKIRSRVYKNLFNLKKD